MDWTRRRAFSSPPAGQALGILAHRCGELVSPVEHPELPANIVICQDPKTGSDLVRGHDSEQRSKHSGHIATRRHTRKKSLIEEAAKARVPPRSNGQDLSAPAGSGGKNEWQPRSNASVIDRQLDLEKVGAVQDQVVRIEFLGPTRRKRLDAGLELGRRKAKAEMPGRHIGFGSADIGGPIKYLPVEIGDLDSIRVPNADVLDSSKSQAMKGRASESPRPDHHDAHRRSVVLPPAERR